MLRSFIKIRLPIPIGRSASWRYFSSVTDTDTISDDGSDSIVSFSNKQAICIGRRKTSVAKVWMKEGSGQFTVNGKSLYDYFLPIQREHCLGPFLISNTAGLFDVVTNVHGGGISGQAGAIRLGVSRALNEMNAAWRSPLKKAGMMTRDSRRVERKKPGQKKARKQYQWVKR